jgi:branched-chain amino acid transport system substrate-binding protein
MNAAIQLALRERNFHAGRYPIAFQACDDGTPSTVTTDSGRCVANAHAYARDASVVGVVGTFESSCATQELPILNRAPGGPLAMVSPSNTYVGLTHAGPGAAPGDPARYRPTGQPSYARVVAPDDVQGAADALLARHLGVRRAYAFSDSSPYGHGLAVAFARAAARLGISVVGSARWDRDRRLVARARAAHADAIFLAGYPDTGGDDLLVALRRRLHPAPRLLLSDGFWGSANVARLGPTAEGLMISFAGPPLDRLPPAGARFARLLGRAVGARPLNYSIYAGEATHLLLDAIARSNGTRSSVTRQLLSARVHHGILGDFAITPQGDTTAREITIYRVTDGRLRTWGVIHPRPALVRDVGPTSRERSLP